MLLLLLESNEELQDEGQRGVLSAIKNASVIREGTARESYFIVIELPFYHYDTFMC